MLGTAGGVWAPPATLPTEVTMSKFKGRGFAVNDRAIMPIRHPSTNAPMVDAAGKEAFLCLGSVHGEQARRTRQAIQQKRIDARVRKVSLEEAERETAEVLSSVVYNWHLVDPLGEVIDVPCTPANALDLFQTDEFYFIFEQAHAFADNAGNFPPTSSTS